MMSTTDKTITSILEIKNNPKILDSGFDRVYTVISDKTTNETISTYISELDSSIGLFDFSNIFDIKKFRPEYDYATLKLSAYKDKEDDLNKLWVVYELIVAANGNYYVIDKIDSENGDADFKHLALGQKYYIRASDLSGEYKSQMTEFIPTEKDQDMHIQLLTTYNLASNSGFSYYFILKNVIDENPYVYIENQPKLNLVKNTNGTYSITGIPSNRIITLNVEHEKGLLVQSDSLTLTINGSFTALDPTYSIIYEAPYRVLKQNNPDIDILLSEEPFYSKAIVLSNHESSKNYKYILYKNTGNNYYIEDASYDSVSTCKISQNIDHAADVIHIKNLNGELHTGDVLVVGEERLLLLNYNTSTNIITVKRGIDNTIPLVHIVDDIIYVENINNISTSWFNNDDEVVFNLAGKTFSDESLVRPERDIIFTPSNIINNIYAPANVTINNKQLETIDIVDSIHVAWSRRNKKNERILGYYDDIDIEPEIGTTYTVRIYDQSGKTILKEITGIANNYIDIDVGDMYRILFVVRVYAVINGNESKSTIPHICRLYTKYFDFIIPDNEDEYTPPVGIVNFKF